jgi:hypothetical protein
LDRIVSVLKAFCKAQKPTEEVAAWGKAAEFRFVVISPDPNSWTSNGSLQRMSKRCGKLGMTLVTDFSIVVDIKASPDEVAVVSLDVERWPEWTSTMTSARRLNEGLLAVESRARIRQPSQRYLANEGEGLRKRCEG